MASGFTDCNPLIVISKVVSSLTFKRYFTHNMNKDAQTENIPDDLKQIEATFNKSKAIQHYLQTEIHKYL